MLPSSPCLTFLVKFHVEKWYHGAVHTSVKEAVLLHIIKEEEWGFFRGGYVEDIQHQCNHV